jgi:hypothetical protein
MAQPLQKRENQNSNEALTYHYNLKKVWNSIFLHLQPSPQRNRNQNLLQRAIFGR